MLHPPISHLAIAALVPVVTLGLPLGLYALLTRGRRRSMRAIRAGASQRGWRFRLRRWSGDPTSFRLDGRTRAGLDWVLKTIGAGTETSSPGWNAQLHLTFPVLAGKQDFALFPRESYDRGGADLKSRVSPALQAQLTRFSAALGGASEFFCEAVQMPTGLPAFDAVYEIRVLPGVFRRLLDTELAARTLHWPREAIAPHSVLFWRDPFGVHLVVRLPAPANWPTVCYAVELAEQLASTLPAGSVPSAPPSTVDRIIAQLQR